MYQAMIEETVREGLLVAVAICFPMLAAGLITGLVIGLFQALTSIQEMSLTFVPKLAVMMAVYWVSMSFMTGKLTDFFNEWIMMQISAL